METKDITKDYVLELRKGEYTLENKAERVLMESNIDSFPVNVWNIAKGLGFMVYEANFRNKNTSGMMIDKKEVPEILREQNVKRAIILNRSESKENQAFTVAHEIAHFVLHVDEKNDFFEAYHILRGKDKCELSEDEENKKKIEDEADSFAAMLLMPEKLFLKCFVESGNKNNIEMLIKELASAFMVSEEAVRRRFDELEIALK